MAEFLRENRLRWFGHVQRRAKDDATRKKKLQITGARWKAKSRQTKAVAGPSLWNNLPLTIREASTLTTYMLKTHLFRIAFKALC